MPATVSFVQNSSNVEDPPELNFAGLHFTLTAQNAQSQPIQPIKALSLAVSYDPACLGGLRESELHLRRWIDESREEVASGVYIYKIVDTDSGQQSYGRLVIIR